MEVDRKPEKQPAGNRVFKVCLTGGPCAGKSTAKVMVQKRFEDRFTVFFLPELAETTFTAGVTIVPSEFTPDTHVIFQTNIMQMQIHLEDYFAKIASIQKRDVIIVCDRGVLDNIAYCSDEVKARIFAETRWTMEEIRDRRYDAVIHLVTAADGAEEFYSLSNNKARSETPEMARAIDKKIQNAWNGHHNFSVIANTRVDSFNHKMEEVYKCVTRTVHEDYEPLVIHNYAIDKEFSTSLLPEEIDLEEHILEICYLLPETPKEEVIIKRRISQTSTGETYSLVRKRKLSNGQEIENARLLDQRSYNDYIAMVDPSKNPETKEQISFIFDNHVCKIQTEVIEGERISTLASEHPELVDSSLGVILQLTLNSNSNDESSPVANEAQN